jgi:urease accessory protein
MRPSITLPPRLIAILAAAMPVAALAHTGAGQVEGFLQGVAHPFTGVDHMLAMVAVGLLAGRMGGRAVWLLPASFMTIMAVGGLLGMAGIALPFAEFGIACSLVAFGCLLGSGRDMTVAMTMALVGFFALFHGHAHGTEVARDISGVAYEAGLLVATGILHALGVGVALASTRHRRIAKPFLRFSGGIVALAGAGVLMGWV